jgi:hypothetical protein
MAAFLQHYKMSSFSPFVYTHRVLWSTLLVAQLVEVLR